jgi:uncharacterized protein
MSNIIALDVTDFCLSRTALLNVINWFSKKSEQPTSSGCLKFQVSHCYTSCIMVKTWMIASGLSIYLLAQSAVAGQFEDGQAAYDRGEYTVALQLWKPLADQGDARAQFHLGDIYLDGNGVSQNETEGLKWLRLAAEQGFAEAQNTLGNWYIDEQENDIDTPKDYAEVLTWYQLAAEQGNAGGQNNLGYMYDTGKGVPQDYVEAVKWYRLAADQGNAEAQSNLGSMYGGGKGVPQDFVQAHMWFSLAFVGFPARDDLIDWSLSRKKDLDAIATKMTREQIVEAQRLARDWLAVHRKK